MSTQTIEQALATITRCPLDGAWMADGKCGTQDARHQQEAAADEAEHRQAWAALGVKL